ncbi:PilZ domain-containing protein [Niallia nealsonii]|uniref:PilZ domain-containing protein n=1 Tax=Niallia nealsonii TaxID=115979 RepID=A0A2N0YY61_9BACI|nr:PilZ domain-containing protein [Niallia nealsonii]PKG22196.1 PilZ domain-containing protein [Niallia nealsonii]
MKYKREEPFRYSFPDPIDGELTLKKLDDETTFNIGKATIRDISPNGIKFASHLDLPVNDDRILFYITFSIKNKKISIPGNITWKKKQLNQYIYGYQAQNAQEKQEEIIEELKEYAKARLKDN